MKRWTLALGTLTVLAVSWYAAMAFQHAEAPIRLGILHSQTGPLAISEQSMIDAELMAIEEINKEEGLLGRRVEAVVADGRSDPKVFAEQARWLINQEKVRVIFGCWASATRKSVKPIVEQLDHLLISLPMSPRQQTKASPDQVADRTQRPRVSPLARKPLEEPRPAR